MLQSNSGARPLLQRTLGKPGIDEQTRDHYAALYARPGAIHNAFSGQFAPFSQDAIDNQELLAKGKLKIPVLAIGGDQSHGAQLATEVGLPLPMCAVP